MFFYLKISCKDKRILEIFLRLLTKIKFLSVFVKPFPKNEKRKFITVLKSPHVNKTAQEQFEYRFYSKHFLVHSFKPATFFLLLKKLKSLSFPGLNLEVKGLLENNTLHKNVLQVINPDNIILKSIKSLNLNRRIHKKICCNKSFKQTLQNCRPDFLSHKKYVQLFDLYGEVCLKKAFYFT